MFKINRLGVESYELVCRTQNTERVRHIETNRDTAEVISNMLVFRFVISDEFCDVMDNKNNGKIKLIHAEIDENGNMQVVDTNGILYILKLGAKIGGSYAGRYYTLMRPVCGGGHDLTLLEGQMFCNTCNLIMEKPAKLI